jgi:Mn2+/Fe2+ NRAMP family transporter
MIAPLMIADYSSGELDFSSKRFKLMTALACVIGLTVPAFGFNPIKAQIITQVFNVFILPLVILSMMILINKKSLMADHKAGIGLNVGLFGALFFSLVISYNGVVAILESINT